MIPQDCIRIEYLPKELIHREHIHTENRISPACRLTRPTGAVFRETLMKAFPFPDLRCEAAISAANPCDPPEGSKEALN